MKGTRDWVCPTCGLRYRDYRPSLPSFAEVKTIMLEESREAVSRGQFNYTSKRPAVLGRLHQLKVAAWKDDHLFWCCGGNDEVATALLREAGL